MCFTVNVNLIKEEIEKRYGINFPDKYRYEPSYYYHAFSFPELAAICSGYSTVRFLKWGLIPSWVRNDEQSWINPDSSPALLSEMLRPCPEDVLAAHTIAPLINDRTKVRNTPEITREYIWDIPDTLF